MDIREIIQNLMASRGTDVPKNTTIVPKNEVDQKAIVNQILQGMSRGDLPQGQPVQVAGNDIVHRILPSGTTLSYTVLSKNPDGTLVVRAIVPDGYPQANSFTAPASAFSDTKQAKPYK